ncbi:Serine/threonine-protein phosphatase PP1 isozyme 1 [Toxocara canis]|uniref:Serine/threonine-protein phosphatase n=1 Tax=Toxocara canis TaxID=6265 RepID=A0A0B2VHV7_TOXCA|nr:Serine/threonine-protein phosphatase PP1 isozyme 1 [Toxocara canis]
MLIAPYRNIALLLDSHHKVNKTEQMNAPKAPVAANQGAPPGPAPTESKESKKTVHEAFLKKHLQFRDGEDINYKAKELFVIIREMKDLVSAEKSLLEVPAPCVIVGDIHGQYEDLHRMFIMTGRNGRSGATMRRYLFLGDYVDRGPHSLECVCCLFAYKLAFPRMFNLLRGNHEAAFINKNYGFYQELKDRFDEPQALLLWKMFNDVFDYLPLAALVHGKILCMHGGIGPRLNTLDDIRNIKRPIKNMDESELACDLLWADPVIDLSGYVRNSVRGVSVCFGEDTVLRLCNNLKLDMIVRAHQNNKGAVMTVSRNLKVGFLLLAPVNEATSGKECFQRVYTRTSAETGYTPKAVVCDNSVITQYDPSEVYNAEKMRQDAEKASQQQQLQPQPSAPSAS